MMNLAPLSNANLSAIRLVATDIDGTLTQDGKFTPELMTQSARLRAAKIDVLLVTGRSAGWVSGLSNYLPVAGAIGENGGCYVAGGRECQILPPLEIADLDRHRQALARCFRNLQQDYPHLKISSDNRFRLTDLTFDLDRLTAEDLENIYRRCRGWGWDFTYSTIQCHIKLPSHSKAMGIKSIVDRHFPDLTADRILTVGDSPNDGSMFDRSCFPHSVGVANITHYRDRMAHLPAYITEFPEVAGFGEIVDRLVASTN
jgi:HAD superfamily hydrolase (TIGR01484 family)